MKFYNLLFGMFLLFGLVACNDDDAKSPNELGGETNLSQNQVGATWSVYPEIFDSSVNGLDDVGKTVKVVKSNNGNIEVLAQIRFNEKHFHILDSLLGLNNTSDEAKKVVLDLYKTKYGFTLDTTDKNNMKLDFTIKGKVTSEGIQDYTLSKGDESKPFTIVKYADNVGTKYEFTDAEGKKIVRTITHKDEVDSYRIAFWNIKITKIEEVKDDPIISKITYYTNHKFGLVNIVYELKNGKTANIALIPDTVKP